MNSSSPSFSKAVIIGSGRVGTTIAYSLSLQLIVPEIVLIDRDHERAVGEAMDLNHGLSYYENLNIYAGDYSNCKDADYIIITAGAAQKPGQTRLDVAKENTEIMKKIIPEVLKYNTTAKFIIVSNPVDVLTYATLKISGLPKNQVFGTGTMLDTARFKFLLGNHFEVGPSSIHAFIIGEHGDTELPVLSSANIAGIPLTELEKYDKAKIDKIFERTKNAAYEVIKHKGSTFYAIGIITTKIIQAMEHDQNRIFPVSTLMEGQYGIKDICLSIPAVVNRNGIKKTLEIKLSNKEIDDLVKSAAKLKQVSDSLGL